MSTFLHVYGDDYSALEFEKNYDVQEFYNEMIKDGVYKKVIEDENYYIEVKIVQFEEVDDDFVTFVQNELCDYDMLKHENIYRVKYVE